jgi:hypothetical protein
MASSNVLGVQDAYQLINAISAQSIGATGLTATDTSSFIKVAEAIMQTGVESTMNALAYVLGRTIFSIRPYSSKLASLERDPERWGMITRKVTYLMMGAVPSQNWNTQLDATQLADGASVDPFEINGVKTVQFNIPGAESLETKYTQFMNQLRVALRSEAEFVEFFNGLGRHVLNMIEKQKESKSRAVLANFIAGKVAMNNGVRDLVYDYNVAFNTSYTREQLLTTYAESFWKFVAAEIKTDSERLTNMSVSNHCSLSGYDPIVRHTPAERQKLVVYGPAFNAQKAYVFSTIFNPQYLNISTTEELTHWQAEDYPASISCTPSILNTTTGEANAAGSNVAIPYVLGVLFDEEALGIMPKFESAGSIYNPHGDYTNFVWHWLYKSYCDYTENGIVYVLGDLPTEDGPKINYVYYVPSSAYTMPAWDPDTLTYTGTVTAGSSRTLIFSLDTGCYVKSATINGEDYVSHDPVAAVAGEEYVYIVTVAKPGYADVTYTITISCPDNAKNGDDEEPAEEEPTRSTKKTSSK